MIYLITFVKAQGFVGTIDELEIGMNKPRGGWELMTTENWQGLEYACLGQLGAGAILQVALFVYPRANIWSYILAGYLLVFGTCGAILGGCMRTQTNRIIAITLAILAGIVILCACILIYGYEQYF
ncbi:hypothetical protein EJ419_05640 [Alloscardovia theropitheci]|uniref:Uncharacterized protein n=1 Tax=Alloscardovia theropitheci TaxID=2496842 RepID=A0A4R0QWM7_9BIFI|nr:hypothetical protein [Alloscardovia theropitheci]TCD53920.1 hypothetical protein EJ419_05640 [Alloscardovia theropitheci]